MSERKKIIKHVAKTISHHEEDFGFPAWENLDKWARDDYKETAHRVLVALAEYFDGWEDLEPAQVTDEDWFITTGLLDLFRGVDA